MAEVSYKDTYGYYHLRVNPTLDQVMGMKRQDKTLPLPDRSAKWMALSWYRALLLDAGKKFEEVEGAAHQYRESGAELPESAARFHPSAVGQDPMFDRIDDHNERMQQNRAYEAAAVMQHQHRQQQTAETRREQLRLSYGPNKMNSVIEAHHDQLEEVNIPHIMPAPRLPPPVKVWKTPPQQYAAAGQVQAPEFPTYEMLNLGQVANIKSAALRLDQAMTYERIREFAVQPTWTS